MKIYLCGQMTGIAQFNIPRFDEVAADLRAQGYDVVSPAELDDPETRRIALASPNGAPGTGSANGETWGDFLARDVKLIADGGIEGIVFIGTFTIHLPSCLYRSAAKRTGLPTSPHPFKDPANRVDNGEISLKNKMPRLSLNRS